jgi:hypothetical protein
MREGEKAMKIQDQACLVSLNMGKFGIKKKDKKATTAAVEKFRVKEGSVEATKFIIADRHLDEIDKLQGEMRTYHYQATIPYGRTKGLSILPTKMVADYMQFVSDLTARHHTAVDKFMQLYPALKAEAEIDLHGTVDGLFDSGDYPLASTVRNKFYVETHVYPIPEGSDLHIQIDQEDLQRMQDEIEENMRTSQKSAYEDLWKRVYKVVSNVKDKMKQGPDGKFPIYRDSLIDHVRDMAEMLPKLNFMEDPELSMMANRLQKELGRYNPAELRDNEHLRKEAFEKADAILTKVNKIMGGEANIETNGNVPKAPEPSPEPILEPAPIVPVAAPKAKEAAPKAEPESYTNPYLEKMKKAGLI